MVGGGIVTFDIESGSMALLIVGPFCYAYRYITLRWGGVDYWVVAICGTLGAMVLYRCGFVIALYLL